MELKDYTRVILRDWVIVSLLFVLIVALIPFTSQVAPPTHSLAWTVYFDPPADLHAPELARYGISLPTILPRSQPQGPEAGALEFLNVPPLLHGSRASRSRSGPHD